MKNHPFLALLLPMASVAFVTALAAAPADRAACGGEPLRLNVRYQEETSQDSGRFHRLHRQEEWAGEKTALIVCDVWDLHHCLNAVRRLEEFAPRLNQVVAEARRRGVTIIHAPSDCMQSYADHPARKRAQDVPRAKPLPEDISSWCSKIPAEERGVYPIDQSDGGEDDDPEEHAAWAAKLKAMGRNPGTPWKMQSKLIEIDAQRDYLSDRGEEVWSILEHHGIENVILTGVHANMCVLGRPFGLRQMVRNGKRTVLMRDMTDCMYNPQRWPFVSHFTGNDLIVAHVERYVCPTITSDQLLGGKPFRFSGDTRPHLAIVIAEDEYQTERTLPRFAAEQLGKQFQVSLVFGSDRQRNDIPGLETLKDADLLLLSVRRRVLPESQMALLKQFVAAGKPVLGIRTASHAFSLRNQQPPDGYADWPELDADVFGGNYQGHHGNQLKSTVAVVPEQAEHPIVAGLPVKTFPQGGSLYRNTPLREGAQPLLRATAEGVMPEPVAWVFERPAVPGKSAPGRSFYTSLGHRADFEHPAFVHVLTAALHWAAGLESPAAEAPAANSSAANSSAANSSVANSSAANSREANPAAPPDHWRLVRVPDGQPPKGSTSTGPATVGWYRAAVRLPRDWTKDQPVWIDLGAGHADSQVWFNGHRLARVESPTEQASGTTAESPAAGFRVSQEWIQTDDANLVVVRVSASTSDAGPFCVPPVVRSGKSRLTLAGLWQHRAGDEPSWANMPLPAKFGASTDIYYEP